MMPKPGKKGPHDARKAVTYAAVPAEYAPLLAALAAEGAKYEGRSRAYLAKLALKRFLQAEGLLDEKGKPVGGKPGG